MPEEIETIEKWFSLSEYVKTKYKDEEYKKKNYIWGKKHRRDIKDYRNLIYEFVTCYEILYVMGAIKKDEKIKELKWSKAYDEDVLIILCIIKQLHKSNWEKISNKDLILIWWLAFDKEVYKNESRLKWKKEIKNILKYQKLPKDYLNFFDKKDNKYLDKNSFQKYIARLNIERIKNFLIIILEAIDCIQWKDLTFYIFSFPSSFDECFHYYVNKMTWLIFPRLSNDKKLNNNYKKIIEVYKEWKAESQYKSNNAKVLDYIYRNSRDVFIKSFS